MSKRQAARTGLSRPREIENELLEASWREKGGAVSSGTDRTAASQAFQARAASVHHGVDLTAIPIRETNAVEAGLALLHHATGNALFGDALEELRRLGLCGPGFDEKLTAMLPPCDADLGLAKRVGDLKVDGLSQAAAVERVAAEMAVPSASFDGAKITVKRSLKATRGK